MANDSNGDEAGAKAAPSREAEAQAVRDKMARLRALRLAHEAANPTPTKTAPTRSRTGKKGAAKPVALSDWLNEQDQQGRRK